MPRFAGGFAGLDRPLPTEVGLGIGSIAKCGLGEAPNPEQVGSKKEVER